MLTIKIILWASVALGCVGLLLLCLANRLGYKEYLHEDGTLPLVPDPPVSPGRQIEVLSKFTIVKEVSVEFLDGINGRGFHS